MPFSMFRISLSRLAGIAAASVLLAARMASAQYTVQILPPPADFPSDRDISRGFAINSAGQVLGYVFAAGFETRPVLWTNGVPQYLTLPLGYEVTSFPGHFFLNDSGRAVMSVVPTGGPQYASRTAYWDDPASPQLVPLAPNTCGSSGGVPQDTPWGLNNAGHILIGSYDCANLWRWDGLDEFDFHELVPLNQIGSGLCAATIYTLQAGRSHLNDLDHVALEYGTANSNCPTPVKSTGILIGAFFSPVLDVPLDGGVFDFNNDDQLLTGDAGDIKYWDGLTSVEFGAVSASLNDRSEIVFWDHGVPKRYKDGVTTEIVLPPVPDAVSSGGGSIINTVGQLLSSAFVGPQIGPVLERAIVFTPRTPAITWPKPVDITYGTALGLQQLNATANVPGTFAYNPPAGTGLGAAAIQFLSVTFTPADLLHYDPATVSNSIGVLPASLAIKADDAGKVFGAPMPSLTATFTGFVNGDGPGNLLGSLALTTSATSTSPPGAYSIVPGGVSSPNYAISFVPGTLTIAPANTTASVQALPTTTTELQPVILVATIVPVAPGAGTVDGTVQFKDGSSLLGTGTVANGLAYLLVNGLTPGVHPVTVAYSGTGSFAASTSQILNVTVQPLVNSSFTLMFPLTQPQVVGQPALFAALVVGLGGGPTPAGTVQFTDGATVRGSAALNGSGVAIFSMPALDAGAHLIGARYLGGGSYASSTASPVLQTIYGGARPASTGVALTLSPTPSLVDQPITFTATVTGGATTGTVVFFIDGFTLGSAPVADVGGSVKATFTLAGLLSAGTHVMSAAYVGSAGFAASTLQVPAVQVIQSSGGPSSEAGHSLESLLAAKAASLLRK
jgi:hypothetical protein